MTDEILRKCPRLASLPRYGCRNRDAWKRLKLARQFLLNRGGDTYLVNEGSWAHNLVNTDV